MTKAVIDCLILGHFEPDFQITEQSTKLSSGNSYFYQYLNSEFIQHQGNKFTAEALFNHFQYKKDALPFSPLRLSNIFSNTIAYLSSFLKKNGLTFSYFDSISIDNTEIIENLSNVSYRTIAITTTYYFSEAPVTTIVNFVRSFQPSAKIIVGGPYLSMNVSKDNDNNGLFSGIGADYYIHSPEGEKSLLLLLNALKHHESVKNVPNLYYFENETWKFTKTIIENNLLEENPVQWSIFNDRKFQIASIRTAKSCPFSCSFCNYPFFAGKHQTASVESVEKELVQLRLLGGVSHIIFIDDTFNVPSQRFKELLKMLIRNKFSFKWCCYLRCQFIDDEIAGLMKESGCELAFLGIESGNNTILKNMNKHVTVEQYYQGIELLTKYEISSVMSYIIGFPGETEDTVNDTIDFINNAQPTFFRGMIWYCDINAPIYKKKNQFELKGQGYSWSHATMNSETAAFFDNEMIFKIKNSIWVRHYDLDALFVFCLLSRKFPWQWIKDFMNYFANSIKIKLDAPKRKNIVVTNGSEFRKFSSLAQ